MNHLAHALLAGPHPDHRLGAFLGDHVKGRLALARMHPERARGVLLHRRIDAWSDAHPAVVGLRERSGRKWRRYSGIVFDVLFDSVLVRRWSDYADRPLDEFAAGLDALLLAHRDELPPRLGRFAAWARAVGLWQRYDQRDMLDEIFARLARRHGRSEPLARGTVLLDEMGADIEAAFDRLFPDLARRARRYLQDGGGAPGPTRAPG